MVHWYAVRPVEVESTEFKAIKQTVRAAGGCGVEAQEVYITEKRNAGRKGRINAARRHHCLKGCI